MKSFDKEIQAMISNKKEKQLFKYDVNLANIGMLVSNYLIVNNINERDFANRIDISLFSLKEVENGENVSSSVLHEIVKYIKKDNNPKKPSYSISLSR